MPDDFVECELCGKTPKYCKIVNAILDKDILNLCEICAAMEGAVVIHKPNNNQLIESKRPYTVHERLVRVSGVNMPPSIKGGLKGSEENTLSSLQDEWLKRKEQEKVNY